MATIKYAAGTPETAESFEDAPVALELGEPPRCHDIEGPYGALVATMAPLEAPPPSVAAFDASVRVSPTSLAPTMASSWGGRVGDVLAVLPPAVWKRVALYTALFVVLGNTVRAGGFAMSTNAAALALVVVAVIGTRASSARRS